MQPSMPAISTGVQAVNKGAVPPGDICSLGEKFQGWRFEQLSSLYKTLSLIPNIHQGVSKKHISLNG